ncbi:hypothetical protein LSCM1_00267 [Leishmania martiniquensis]|uniref:Uncharacterized protein n=1 Tax=Leishmania martiniquensis TaxID=1580590 RepID=A0A836GBM8_9TRYP|nr:hypothetical protein LSCM1_00267 [Leishmania martiniquensis]
MTCELNKPMADVAVATTAPKLVTLKEAIEQDGLPPTPSATQRRLMGVHITGCPSLVNGHMLPRHKTVANDFSSIDPLQYRKAHKVRNNNTASYIEREENVLGMLTTNQCVNRMTRLGVQLRDEWAKNPKDAPTVNSLSLRGYHSRFLAPSFDQRSTYRWDYCQWEPDGLHDTIRREQLATYRDAWTEDERADVAISMKIPYLTMGVSSDRLKDKSTIYRKDFMEYATPEEYRTLSHKTNLEDLGSTYAYSAYSVDDPRRQVVYDAAVAALKTPHSVLEKTFSPRSSFLDNSAWAKRQSSAREELDRLRAMRRETVRLSAAKRNTSKPSDGPTKNPVVIPGMKGCGYRRAPKESTSYVFLPRDHFNYQAVDNF